MLDTTTLAHAHGAVHHLAACLAATRHAINTNQGVRHMFRLCGRLHGRAHRIWLRYLASYGS